MTEKELTFQSPTLFQRLSGMLGVDFYRLFHTPLFYIFLGVAAIIPALVSMGSFSGTGQEAGNAWNIIASNEPLYVVNDIGEYANMNMVFIFGGIMVSIFIGHDYRSGYVKQIFTNHPKKQDYMISKTLSCAFAMVMMCLAYLLGSIASGLFTGASFEGNVPSLVCAILGKMIMSLGWASLYTFLNVLFRRYFGISIALSFVLGTGILIIALASLFGNTPAWNIFLYGASVYACLSSDFITILVCLACSIGWAILYNVLGSLVLSRSDVY